MNHSMKIRKWLVPVVLLFLSAPLFGDSFELKAVKLDRLEGYYETEGNSVFTLVMPEPQEVVTGKDSGFAELVKKEPEDYLLETVRRGVFTLAGKRYGMVLDSTNLEKEGYDRAHMDLNGNGDLTDDPVVEALPLSAKMHQAYSDSPYRRRQFPRLDLTLEVEGAPVEYGFFLDTFTQVSGQLKSLLMVRLYAGMYRTGEVTLDGKNHNFILVDANSNGTFSDTLKMEDIDAQEREELRPRECDVLFLDPEERDGRPLESLDPSLRPGHFYVAPFLWMDGDFYEFESTAAGDRVKLAPLADRVGYVANPNPYFNAVLYGNQGMVKITSKGEGRCAVPPGEWRLLEYTLSETEMFPHPGSEGMPSATYVSAAGSKLSPVVKVQEGKTAYLPFGPPYKAKVKVSSVRKGRLLSGPRASLKLDITGSAGEIVNRIRVRGSNPPPPHLTVKTPDGQVVEDGHFHYG